MATVPITKDKLSARLSDLNAQVTALIQALASAGGGFLPTGGGNPYLAMTPAQTKQEDLIDYTSNFGIEILFQ